MTWIKIPIQEGEVITPKMVNLNDIILIEADSGNEKKTVLTKINGTTIQADVPFFAVVDCVKPVICPNLTDENGSPV